jgi:plasmid stabilization system protein ParE
VIPYSFHPDAEAELSAAAEFYESRMKGLGRLLSVEVQRTISFIREYPDVGAAIRLPIRRALVDGFPYAVIYRRGPESIHVLAVAHLHRRPNYWRRRKAAP